MTLVHKRCTDSLLFAVFGKTAMINLARFTPSDLGTHIT